MTKPVAIITGATGGMGLACTELFAKDHQLLLSDVSQDKLDMQFLRLRQKGVPVEIFACDISKSEDVSKLVAQGTEMGKIGALVHTAGISPMMDQPKRILEVNLIGTSLLLKALTPHMKDGAAAVCIASMAGTMVLGETSPELNSILANALEGDLFNRLDNFENGKVYENAYGFSKLGIQLLVQKYAPSWGRQNARITSISPGIIDTPMGNFEYENQPLMKVMVDSTPLGRMGVPDEIAKVVRFLISKDASYITGVDLLVDGGTTNNLARLISSGEVTMPERNEMN